MKINSIEPQFDDIDGERGLFIYLYVAYANYSKTWIERIVQDDTNGNRFDRSKILYIAKFLKFKQNIFSYS